ncbi:PREDICTED: uncharacterized protein LOC106809727 [Priapulus caudatus]|uniref:Uncharacterized protein LOC106809727 n=1 Tax=Priapulus caudatus TaxID=37621 RepID=A0ABM1E877_PRICU|nr:PREDICTED: uncharacterized protein LOC106809727 [Priapulus caudatus]
MAALSSVVVSLLVLCVCVKAAAPTSRWIEYIPGNITLILGAPHGGTEQPTSIPVRDAGCYINGKCVYRHDCGTKDFSKCKVTTVQDSYTLETTKAVADAMARKYGVRPHVVLNLLHRNRLDANRGKPDAAFGDTEAEAAWNQWFDYIESSKGDGIALFIDLHGVSSHPEKWVEIGYLIKGAQLDSGDYTYNDSSIRHLASRVGIDFRELLHGRASLGYRFDRLGYNVVPSPTHPGPDGGKYYSGGDNTRAHGSKYGGIVDAIQIEMPKHLRDEAICVTFCPDLADIIYDFWARYYRQR